MTDSLSLSLLGPAITRHESVRLDVLDRLDGQVVMFNLPVTLRDLGASRIVTESPVPIPIGNHHVLRFTTSDGDELVITAAVTHQRAVDPPGGLPHFVTGFALTEHAG